MSTRRFEREEPPPRSKCISCLCVSWKVFTCVFSHVTLIALVVSYCVAGAFLFEHLEKGNEMLVSSKAVNNLLTQPVVACERQALANCDIYQANEL